MDTYTIPCPRCHGRGIYYASVHNGQPVPAKPDNGVCYQCHGAKTIQIRKEGTIMKTTPTPTTPIKATKRLSTSKDTL